MGNSRSFLKMSGALSFQSFNVWLKSVTERKEVGRQRVDDDMVEDGWVSKKGEAPKFILFFSPLGFLSVLTYLLSKHVCNMRSDTNVWVRGWVKQGGSLEILRRLSTDGLLYWINQGHFTWTLHTEVFGRARSAATGKVMLVRQSRTLARSEISTNTEQIATLGKNFPLVVLSGLVWYGPWQINIRKYKE